jgi:hypothetical protein
MAVLISVAVPVMVVWVVPPLQLLVVVMVVVRPILDFRILSVWIVVATVTVTVPPLQLLVVVVV